YNLAGNVMSFADGNLDPGSVYYYRVRASSGNFVSTNTNIARAMTWTDFPIGGAGGSVDFSAGAFTLTGSGGGIGGSIDAFNAVGKVVNGDVSIIARLASVTNANANTEAGLMFRP